MPHLPYLAKHVSICDRLRVAGVRHIWAGSQMFTETGGEGALVVGVTSQYRAERGRWALTLQFPGRYRWRWAVRPGVRRVSVWACAQAPNPGAALLRVLAAPSVGLTQTLEAALGSPTTTWQLLGPLSFVASAEGVVYVEVENRACSQTEQTCWFDALELI